MMAVLRRQTQMDLCEFEARLVYRAIFRKARAGTKSFGNSGWQQRQPRRARRTGFCDSKFIINAAVILTNKVKVKITIRVSQEKATGCV